MAKKNIIQKIILKSLSNKKLISIKSIKKNFYKNIFKDEQKQINYIDKKIDYAINRSIKNLLTNGFIECFNSDNTRYFRVTPLGKHKLNNIILENDNGLISTKWDGFWRIIILDLSENRKSEREALRYLLKKAGFYCVKNAVWISMYPFEHLFTNIKKDLGLSSEMMIIVTNKLDEETEKEFFSVCEMK